MYMCIRVLHEKQRETRNYNKQVRNSRFILEILTKRRETELFMNRTNNDCWVKHLHNSGDTLRGFIFMFASRRTLPIFVYFINLPKQGHITGAAEGAGLQNQEPHVQSSTHAKTAIDEQPHVAQHCYASNVGKSCIGRKRSPAPRKLLQPEGG